MTKQGYRLSDEHKKNIGKATKKMWEDGVFNSERIREIWRNTALLGIAKKGKESPNKFVPSQEMMADYSNMGDKDLSSKYGISLALVIRTRKRYNLPRFNNQHGTVKHEFRDGVEFKYCQYKKHWEPITSFGLNRTRWDGLRGWCKECERENNSKYYDKNDGASKMRKYLKTEKGKESRRAVMRRVWAKRRGCYIKFELDDEKKAYSLCKESCAYCKVSIGFDDLEFDHFIPVKLGGMTEPKNMLPSCSNCNRGKGGKRDKDPYQWLTTRFGIYLGEQIYNDCVRALESIGDQNG